MGGFDLLETSVFRSNRADATTRTRLSSRLIMVALQVDQLCPPKAPPTVGATTIGIDSRDRFVVNGSEPYKSHWFSIVALGIDKESLPSDVVLGRAA